MGGDYKKNFKAAMKKIAKSVGEDCIVVGDEGKPIDRIELPFYYLSQNIGGGLPRGRLIEVFGFEESGKTTLALSFVAAMQKYGPVLYLDPEHALDINYAKVCGVQLDDRWLYADPITSEECFTIAKTFIEENAIVGFVFDSLPAAPTQSEIDGEVGDQRIAEQAKVISRGLKKILGLVSKTNTVAIFINHLKDEIKMTGGRYKSFTTPGGRALKFYASLRLKCSKGKSEYLQNDGIRTTVKVMKTKVGGNRLQSSEYHIKWDTGIVKEFELLDVGLMTGIIERSGAWYNVGNLKIQGKDKMLESIQKSSKLRKAILASMRSK